MPTHSHFMAHGRVNAPAVSSSSRLGPKPNWVRRTANPRSRNFRPRLARPLHGPIHAANPPRSVDEQSVVITSGDRSAAAEPRRMASSASAASWVVACSSPTPLLSISAFLSFHVSCATSRRQEPHLRVEGTINLPNTFEPIVDLDGLEASCEVVWRRDKERGVRFASPPPSVIPEQTQVVSALSAPQTPVLRRKPRGYSLSARQGVGTRSSGR